MTEQASIVVVLVFGALMFAFLTCSIIIMKARENGRIMKLQRQAQKELFEATVIAETKERDRIYHNIHDQVNPIIRTAMRNLQWHHRNKSKGITTTEREFEEDINLLIVALNEIKSCTHEMVPLLLLDHGLNKALEKEFKRLALSRKIDFAYSDESDPDSCVFIDSNRLLNSYRMLMAIMDNIFRHSKCKTCEMKISGNTQHLEVLFKHNGIGISNDEALEFSKRDTATGLKSCQVRAQMLNAYINYESEPNSEIKIKIPL